jgi:hypothetical protein
MMQNTILTIFVRVSYLSSRDTNDNDIDDHALLLGITAVNSPEDFISAKEIYFLLFEFMGFVDTL